MDSHVSIDLLRKGNLIQVVIICHVSIDLLRKGNLIQVVIICYHL